MRNLTLKAFTEDATLFQEILYSIRCKEGKFHVVEGIGKETDSIVLEATETIAILVNVNDHKVLEVNREDVKLIEHGQVLDLSDEG